MVINLKNSGGIKTTIVLIAFFCSLKSMYAQDTVEKPKKITVKGYPKTQTLHCNGESIVILDDYHKITVIGHCFQIKVYGNKCVIDLETASLITLHGNQNKVTYKTLPGYKTRVSRFGDDNRVTIIE